MLCCFKRNGRHKDEELRADNDCRWKTGESNQHGNNRRYDKDINPYGMLPSPVCYLDSGDSTETDVVVAPSYETGRNGLGHHNDNWKKGSRKYHYEFNGTTVNAQNKVSHPEAKLDPNSELQRKSKLHNEKLPSFSALDRTRKPRVRVEEDSGLQGMEERGGEDEAVSRGVHGKYLDDDEVSLVHKPLTFDTFRGCVSHRKASNSNNKAGNGDNGDPRLPPLAVIAPLSTNCGSPPSSLSHSSRRRSDGQVVRSSSPSGELYVDVKQKPGEFVHDNNVHQVTTKPTTKSSLKDSPVVYHCDAVSVPENKRIERKSLPLLSFLHKASKDEYRKFIHGSSLSEDKGRVNEGYSSLGDAVSPSSQKRSRQGVQRKQSKANKLDQPASELASITPKLNVTFPSTDSLQGLPDQPVTGVLQVSTDARYAQTQHLLQVPELNEPTQRQWEESVKSGDRNKPSAESSKVKKVPPKKPKRKNPPSNASTTESRDAIARCLTNVTSKGAMTSLEAMRPNKAEKSVCVDESKLDNILLAPPLCFKDQVFAGFDSFDEVNGSLV